jgi:hypothetical protein
LTLIPRLPVVRCSHLRRLVIWYNGGSEADGENHIRSDVFRRKQSPSSNSLHVQNDNVPSHGDKRILTLKQPQKKDDLHT